MVGGISGLLFSVGFKGLMGFVGSGIVFGGLFNEVVMDRV